MLKLVSLGSSSKGNCHILYNGKSSLMLDCGINMTKYNYEMSKYNVEGILITHRHLDHCRGIKDKTCLLNAKVYSNPETIEFLGDSIMDYKKVAMSEYKAYRIGGDWIVIPVYVPHDADNFGYIIRDNVTGLNIAYLTDLGYGKYMEFRNINVWIAECNHVRAEMEEKLEHALETDDERIPYYKRVLGDMGHLSLEDSVSLVNDNMSYGLSCVILCHISDSERDYRRYESLYADMLKMDETLKKSVKIHAVNNHLKKPEEYYIIEENKWEKMKF